MLVQVHCVTSLSTPLSTLARLLPPLPIHRGVSFVTLPCTFPPSLSPPPPRSDAEELLREAVALCVSGLGNASPHTAWAQGALAGVLAAQPAKAAEAEELYSR